MEFIVYILCFEPYYKYYNTNAIVMIQYSRLYRLRYPHISVCQDKRYFDQHGNTAELFGQDIVVTEKLDGSQMAVGWKGDRPYLQGKASHIPEFDKRKAYHGAWKWVWQNLDNIEKLRGLLVFGEWCRVQHNLPYDSLPDWFIAFDVYDRKAKRFLYYDDAMAICEDIGIATVPEIHRGPVTYQNLPNLVERKKSAFMSATTLQNIEDRFQIQNRRIKGKGGEEPTWVDRFPESLVFMEGCVIRPLERRPAFETRKKTTWWTNCAKFVAQEFLDAFDEDSSERMRENMVVG